MYFPLSAALALEFTLEFKLQLVSGMWSGT
jgi:hypothetical protein